MTWGEFKQLVESQGVTNDDPIAWIGVNPSQHALDVSRGEADGMLRIFDAYPTRSINNVSDPVRARKDV